MNPPSLFVGGNNENIVNGMAIVLSADSGDAGNIVSHDIYPYTDTVGGPRTRHAAFTDIAASGNGRFTVAGSARYFRPMPARRAVRTSTRRCASGIRRCCSRTVSKPIDASSASRGVGAWRR